MSPLITCGINSAFAELSPTLRQIAHVLRTRSPLELSPVLLPVKVPVRLACLIHAASVRSEPESNSPLKTLGDESQQTHHQSLISAGSRYNHRRSDLLIPVSSVAAALSAAPHPKPGFVDLLNISIKETNTQAAKPELGNAQFNFR